MTSESVSRDGMSASSRSTGSRRAFRRPAGPAPPLPGPRRRVPAVAASVETGCVQPFPAEDARPVRPEERRDHQVAGLRCPDFRADRFDDADELVPHPAPVVVRLHRLVRPEIAATDRGASDHDESVRGLDQPRIRDVLHADSPAAYITVARISCCLPVRAAPYSSSVRDRPTRRAAVVADLEHRQVGHEAVRRRAVPVSSPGSKNTRSPGRITSTGPPRLWANPTPSVT